VLVPVRVPAGDGFAHILTRDLEVLEGSTPLPPIIPVSGGKVTSSLTRRGRTDLKTAMVLRPCEMRATIELAKLGQADLDNIVFITMDCPGALPLQAFHLDPQGEMAKFESACREWKETDIRPICRICEEMGPVAGDLHVGLRGADGSSVPLMAQSDRGMEVMERLRLPLTEDLSFWKEELGKAAHQRREQREGWRGSFGARVQGPDRQLEVFSACINCHNCMRVCPVCYCRLCYFDSERMRHPPEDYLDRAARKGGLRFPPDMMLFHLGRMSHIGLTCVSCGACEDACPASIPIAQLFSLVAEKAQDTFDYRPGRSSTEPLPLAVYREEELEEDGDE
jgi:formate dehydrogenase subunit beta